MTPSRRPLQVSRGLLNGTILREWAQSQGLLVTVPDDEFHVTIAYSRTPVDWNRAGVGEPQLEVHGGARSIDLFGIRRDALAISFESAELAIRWRQIRDAGASWDWPDYQPHITIAYDLPDSKLPEAAELARLVPYTGPLVFGPERFAPLAEGGQPVGAR